MPRIQKLENLENESPDTLSTSPIKAVNGEVLQELTARAPKYGSIIEALDGHGAGIKDIARTIGDIMQYGSSESVKLRAAELAANLQGLNKTQDSNTINFIIKTENGVNLQNIFNPQR